MRVYDKTELKKVQYFNGGVLLITENDYKINCKKVIYCTGFETMNMFKENYAEIVTTFATVSEENLNMYEQLKDILIWDTADPYIYMRTTNDKRLLVSGEDIAYKYNTLTDLLKDKKADNLMQTLNKLFPEIKFIHDYV